MRTVLIVIVCTVLSIAGTLLFIGKDNVATSHETAHARVMRTGVLRCGYFVWPPLLTKDPNSGALGGMTYAFTVELAKALDLKIEWVQEMSFATYLQDIESGKYDMECSEGWPNAKRGKVVFYGVPYAYIPLVLVHREGDDRFEDKAALNDPAVKVATPDGETSSEVYKAQFPKATQVSLPQTTRPDEMILNVTTRKADVTMLDLLSVLDYMDKNPGQIAYKSYDPPLHIIAIAPTLPPDPRFKAMIDTATEQLVNNGTVENLLGKYEPYPGAFLRVAPIYREIH